MDTVYHEIVEHCGVVGSVRDDWTKEVNVVAWNGGKPKIDIRDWDSTHTRMSRGITLTEEQARRVYEILKERYEK